MHLSPLKMLAKLFKVHETLFHLPLGVGRMVSVQDEGKLPTPEVDLFYPGSNLTASSSQHGPSDLRSSMRTGSFEDVIM